MVVQFRRNWILALAASFALFSGLIAVACGGDDEAPGDEPTAPSADASATRGPAQPTDVTLKIGVATNAANANPLLGSGVLQGPGTGALESLTRLAPDASVQPALAESWTLDADGLGITWKLRQGVTFHNGEAFTADDVVKTWAAFTSKESTALYKANLGRVTTLTPRGDLELHMKFSSPFPEIPRIIASTFMVLPGDYFASAGMEGFNRAPIGTGPYKIVSLQPNQDWTLERFEQYWGPKAIVKRIELLAIPDEDARVARLEAGDIDIAIALAPHNADLLRGNDDLIVESFPAILATGLRLNTLQPPFDNVLVRQALNHAIDREAIVKNIWRDNATVGSHVCQPFQEGCVEVQPWSYDPNKSRDLLRQAGFPNGVDVNEEILLVENQLYGKDSYSVVIDQLKQVGIRLNNVQFMTGAQKIERQAAKKFGASEIVSQNITYDSAFDLVRHHTCAAAQSTVCNTDLDKRINDAVSQTTNESRVSAIEALWKDLYDDAFYAILYYQDYTFAYNKSKVAGIPWLTGWSLGIREPNLIVPKED
jgi:peptide/nickel transport system substrate-binding protein